MNQIQISTFTPTVTGNQLRDFPGLYLSLPCWTRDMAVSNNEEGTYSQQDYTTTTLATIAKVVTYILSLGILPLLAAIWVIAARHDNELFFAATEVPPANKSEETDPTIEPPTTDLLEPVEPLDEQRPLAHLISEYRAFEDDDVELKREYEAAIVERLMKEEELADMETSLLEMTSDGSQSDPCLKLLLEKAVQRLKNPITASPQPKPAEEPAPSARNAEEKIDLRALHDARVARQKLKSS